MPLPFVADCYVLGNANMKRKPHILLVDDNPQILEIFSEMLRLQGYEISQAATGKQGLQLVAEKQPDLVILDVVLPDISGIEVCRQIKTNPALTDVFVLLLSGEATSAAHKVGGLEVGADEYIAKPVVWAEFLARIRTVLRLHDTTVALRSSEQHYRRLIEILPDAVLLTDQAGQLTAANPQALALLDYAAADDLLQKTLFDLIEPDEHQRLRTDLEATRQSGSTLSPEYLMVRRDGIPFPIELSAAILTATDHQPQGFVIVARDITERKQAEEELRHLSRRVIEAQELERHRVARELHDGVNQIIASAKLRLRKVQDNAAGLSPSTREILARCYDQLTAALEENRRISYNLRPGDLDELGFIEACHHFSEEFQTRTGIPVQCTIPRQPRRFVPELEQNLFRIVQEALNNIEKHAGAKNIQLEFAWGNRNVKLTIRDDGQGFQPSEVRSTASKRRGSGLTNMRERAISLGGSYDIKSTPGQGTTITVSVPWREPGPHAAAEL